MDYILIIIGLLVAICGLVYQYTIDVDEAYKKGYSKGLYTNVKRYEYDDVCKKDSK